MNGKFDPRAPVHQQQYLWEAQGFSACSTCQECLSVSKGYNRLNIPMLDDKLFEISAIVLSFLVVAASYLLIVWKDRSWINWATPAFIIGVGSKYFFQFLYLCFSANPGGSHYAYAYCYTTYGLTFLVGAVVYAFVKPFNLRRPDFSDDLRALPWILLLLGFLLYLPILIEFHEYLSEPRRIYEQTRTGYGLYFYGSITLVTLGFVSFLFKKKKTFGVSALYFTVCVLLAYLHGTKGQIITYFLIWMLHRVYVDRIAVRAFAASCILVAVAGLVIISFALFQSIADVTELAASVTEYADYVRNAMLVIDDDQSGVRYYGELMIGNEVYSRIPRLLMPNKPKDFGPFILSKRYNPASYRNAEGMGSFDIGVIYADFGPAAIILICTYSAFSAFLISSLIQHFRRGAGVGPFVVFLFMTGVSVIPITGPFYLPESIALGGAVSLVSWLRLLRLTNGRSVQKV